MVNVGQDACSTSACTCLGLCLAPVCGPFLPAACQANPNTINYYCPGGSGSTPEPLRVCESGSQCVQQPSSVGASCSVNQCVCKGDKVVCSSIFPSQCGYVDNALYRCTESGITDIVKLGNLMHTCSETPGGPIFEPNGCACYEDRKVCGSSFGMNCHLTPDMLYTCSRGKNPVPSNLCFPEHCAQPARGSTLKGDQCINPCLCRYRGNASIMFANREIDTWLLCHNLP